MSWNHRVWHSVVCSEDVFQIHETYYNDNGEICACTEGAIVPHGSSLGELEDNLIRMLEATGQPVLETEGFAFAQWSYDELEQSEDNENDY